MKLLRIQLVLGSVLLFTPFITFAQNVNDIPSLFNYVMNILNLVVVPVIFAIAFALFIFKIYQYFIAGGGDEEKVKEGQRFLMWGVIGFAVMFSIWGLINLLVNSFGFDNATRPDIPTFGFSQSGAPSFTFPTYGSTNSSSGGGYGSGNQGGTYVPSNSGGNQQSVYDALTNGASGNGGNSVSGGGGSNTLTGSAGSDNLLSGITNGIGGAANGIYNWFTGGGSSSQGTCPDGSPKEIGVPCLVQDSSGNWTDPSQGTCPDGSPKAVGVPCATDTTGTYSGLYSACPDGQVNNQYGNCVDASTVGSTDTTNNGYVSAPGNETAASCDAAGLTLGVDGNCY